MLARKTRECGINFRETVRSATTVLFIGSQEHGEAGFMTRMLLKEDRNPNRGVKEDTSLLFAKKTLLPLAPYLLNGFLNHILGEWSAPVHDPTPLLLVNARVSSHRT